MRAWEKGVKAISIYRDGSKGAQPVKIKLDEEVDQEVHDEQQDLLALTQEVERLKAELAKQNVPVTATRVKFSCPTTYPLRKKIRLDGHEIYMHVGLYENGSVGEVFLTGVQGSFVAGCSIVLQRFYPWVSNTGVPFEDLYRKVWSGLLCPQKVGMGRFKGMHRLCPLLSLNCLKGMDEGEFKRYADNFYGKNQSVGFLQTFAPLTMNLINASQRSSISKRFDRGRADACWWLRESRVEPTTSPAKTSDPCPVCGSLMVRTGKCKTCVSCSYSDGGCGWKKVVDKIRIVSVRWRTVEMIDCPFLSNIGDTNMKLPKTPTMGILNLRQGSTWISKVVEEILGSFVAETGMRVILSNMRIGEVVELKSDRNGGMVARVVWYVMGSRFAGTYDARGYLVGLYPTSMTIT